MRKTFGLFRGRFQPFHRGHLNICIEIASLHDILVVGIVVIKKNLLESEIKIRMDVSARQSLVNSFNEINNPFSFIQVCQLVKLGLMDGGIPDSKVLIVPHFTPLVFDSDLEMVCMPPKQETILYIPVNSPHNQLSVNQYRLKGWMVEESHPTIRYSGTLIRSLIAQNKDISKYVTPSVLKYLIKQNVIH